MHEPGPTWDEAQALMRAAESAFTAADVDQVLALFTEDVVAEYAGLPPVRGREALRAMLEARFARQQGYRVTKTLCVVSGASVVDTWEGSWTDAVTGRAMCGSGMEWLRLRDGQVSRLRAVLHAWERSGPSGPQIV